MRRFAYWLPVASLLTTMLAGCDIEIFPVPRDGVTYVYDDCVDCYETVYVDPGYTDIVYVDPGYTETVYVDDGPYYEEVVYEEDVVSASVDVSYAEEEYSYAADEYPADDGSYSEDDGAYYEEEEYYDYPYE